MKALVSMSFSPTSLFVARRLHALGYEVTAVDSYRRSYASYSKAVTRHLVAPSMRYDPAGFARCIIDELSKESYDIYLPAFECGFLMASHQDEIRDFTRMVSMPYETIQTVRNKANLQEIGRKAGVRVIESTYMPHSLDEAQAMCRSIRWPVVMKGLSSCNSHGQKIVFDSTDLFHVYQDLVDQEDWSAQLPLIQRYIKGNLVSSVNLARDGEILGRVAFRALRTVPLAGGTSSCRQTISSPACEQFDRQLIASMGWSGFISFDYMEDETTGELYLIDCNPRIAPGAALAYHAGVDLVRGYLDLAMGTSNGPLPVAAENVRGRLHFLDLGWFMMMLGDKHLSRQEKWQYVKQWFKWEQTHDDILTWRDMRPIAVLYGYLLRNLASLLGPKGGELFYEHALFREPALHEFQNPEQAGTVSMQSEG